MSLGDKLTIIAIVVAAIGIPVGVWAVRRWGNRRGSVLFTHESTQLIPDLPFSARDLLKVEFRDMPVRDPHLLTLRLQNVGPRDIASGDFDAGRSIAIKTNCMFYGFVSLSHPKQTAGRALGADGVVDISPMLLKRTEAWEVSALVSGKPKIETDIPLIDVNVLDKKTFDAKIARSILISILRAVLGAFGGGMILAVADEVVSRNRLGDD